MSQDDLKVSAEDVKLMRAMMERISRISSNLDLLISGNAAIYEMVHDKDCRIKELEATLDKILSAETLLEVVNHVEAVQDEDFQPA